jgi:aspartate/methionine/tyrosine aminotransferase
MSGDVEPFRAVVSSFSKYFCMPGWRLGWLLVPPGLVERTRAYIGSMFLSLVGSP